MVLSLALLATSPASATNYHAVAENIENQWTPVLVPTPENFAFAGPVLVKASGSNVVRMQIRYYDNNRDKWVHPESADYGGAYAWDPSAMDWTSHTFYNTENVLMADGTVASLKTTYAGNGVGITDLTYDPENDGYLAFVIASKNLYSGPRFLDDNTVGENYNLTSWTVSASKAWPRHVVDNAEDENLAVLFDENRTAQSASLNFYSWTPRAYSYYKFTAADPSEFHVRFVTVARTPGADPDLGEHSHPMSELDDIGAKYMDVPFDNAADNCQAIWENFFKVLPETGYPQKTEYYEGAVKLYNSVTTPNARVKNHYGTYYLTPWSNALTQSPLMNPQWGWDPPLAASVAYLSSNENILGKLRGFDETTHLTEYKRNGPKGQPQVQSLYFPLGYWNLESPGHEGIAYDIVKERIGNYENGGYVPETGLYDKSGEHADNYYPVQVAQYLHLFKTGEKIARLNDNENLLTLCRGLRENAEEGLDRVMYGNGHYLTTGRVTKENLYGPFFYETSLLPYVPDERAESIYSYWLDEYREEGENAFHFPGGHWYEFSPDHNILTQCGISANPAYFTLLGLYEYGLHHGDFRLYRAFKRYIQTTPPTSGCPPWFGGLYTATFLDLPAVHSLERGIALGPTETHLRVPNVENVGNIDITETEGGWDVEDNLFITDSRTTVNVAEPYDNGYFVLSHDNLRFENATVGSDGEPSDLTIESATDNSVSVSLRRLDAHHAGIVASTDEARFDLSEARLSEPADYVRVNTDKNKITLKGSYRFSLKVTPSAFKTVAVSISKVSPNAKKGATALKAAMEDNSVQSMGLTVAGLHPETEYTLFEDGKVEDSAMTAADGTWRGTIDDVSSVYELVNTKSAGPPHAPSTRKELNIASLLTGHYRGGAFVASSEFNPGEKVIVLARLTVNSQPVSKASVTGHWSGKSFVMKNRQGNKFAGSFTIPKGATPGTYLVSVDTSHDNLQAFASTTITVRKGKGLLGSLIAFLSARWIWIVLIPFVILIISVVWSMVPRTAGISRPAPRLQSIFSEKRKARIEGEMS